MENSLRIPLIGSEPAEEASRRFVAPGNAFLEVEAHPGFADLRRGERQLLDNELERDGIRFLMNRAESGNHAEQGRRDCQREPAAPSSGARYNSLLVVVMHVSPRVEPKKSNK
jgi:hypothetical protein